MREEVRSRRRPRNSIHLRGQIAPHRYIARLGAVAHPSVSIPLFWEDLEEAEKTYALVNVQSTSAPRPGPEPEYAEREVVGFFFVFFLRIFLYVCSVEYAAFAFAADHCGD